MNNSYDNKDNKIEENNKLLEKYSDYNLYTEYYKICNRNIKFNEMHRDINILIISIFIYICLIIFKVNDIQFNYLLFNLLSLLNTITYLILISSYVLGIKSNEIQIIYSEKYYLDKDSNYANKSFIYGKLSRLFNKLTSIFSILSIINLMLLIII